VGCKEIQGMHATLTVNAITRIVTISIVGLVGGKVVHIMDGIIGVEVEGQIAIIFVMVQLPVLMDVTNARRIVTQLRAAMQYSTASAMQVGQVGLTNTDSHAGSVSLANTRTRRAALHAATVL